MHFQTTSITAVLVGLLATVDARIFLGNNFNDNVAWLNGENACNGRRISGRNENPCGRKFTLSNGHTYSVNGCGGTLFILNDDGTFNSECRSEVKDGGCGVQQTYRCPN